MAFRKYFKRKRRGGGYRRRRRSFRSRRTGFKRRARGILHIKRSTTSTLITHTGTAGVSEFTTQTQFRLSDLTTATDLTNLFQLARLNAVVVHLTPSSNVSQYGGAVSITGIPILGWVIDNDDITSTTVAQMQEYNVYKEKRFNTPTKIKIMKPKTPMAAFQTSTGTFAGGVMRNNVWQRTSDPTIVYYGLKFGIYNVNNAQAVTYSIRATHYWSFKKTQ